MLVRAYRLTDKVGVAILKSSAALSSTSAAGVGVLVSGGKGVLGGLLLVLLGIGRVIWSILRRIFNAIWSVVRFFLGLFGGAGVGVVKLTRRASGRAVTAAGTGAAEAMARRAARAEMEAGLAEDPLKVQNRVLSGVTVLLLAALIAVVLWATNPARTGQPVTAGDPGGSIPFALASNATQNATSAAPLASPVPTATTVPEVLQVSGSLAYVVRENGQDDVWAVGVGSRTPIRLTNNPADDRDPAWSPDGRRLAYASRQDGNWDIYVYDLVSGQTTRMTYDLAFQAAPQWSPDGLWLVYESYQGNNLDVYVVSIDGTQLRRVTDHPAPDFSPSWSPDGRRIAFVSWRDGNQDIYVFSLDNPTDAASINLTNTPTRHEDFPAWSPDAGGELLAFSAVDQGIEKVFVKPSNDPQAAAQVLERGRAPAWSPNGASLVFAVDSIEGTQLVAGPFTESGVSTLVIGVSQRASDPTWTGSPLPAALVNTGGLSSGVPQVPYVEQLSSPDQDGLYRLGQLLGVEVLRSSPYLSERVNDSYNALRERVLEIAGWDFLGELDDAFWDLERLPQPGEERRNWYMTGRAFGINRNLIAGFPARIEMVREDLDVNTYWRVFVRVADEAQNGQLGEPLRQLPWDMLSRDQGDVQAYDNGGRLKPDVPGGYYVDFTQLAEDYGWERAASGSDWRANFNTVNYWLFRKPEGLTWYQSMRELYTDPQLGGFAATATPPPVPTVGS